MTLLSLSPNVLEWAAHKRGMTLHEAASAFAAPSRVDSFLAGQLTATQAKKLASWARVPFGFLFLETPPELERPQLPDLRQHPNPEPLDDTFFETLADVQNKQQWFSEYLQEAGAEPLSFIGRYANQTGAAVEAAIAAEIIEKINLSAEVRQKTPTPESFYSYLVDRLEDIGILVFKNGVLGNNSHAPLSAAQFRGFAIVDQYAPAIFVNGKDWSSAWVFTLLHEAAHIWLGKSGVSDVSASRWTALNGIEAACNRIAANVLTPEADFRNEWNKHDTSHLAMLSRTFRVSQLVVARRAYDLGIVNEAFYLAAAQTAQLAASTGGGGDGLSNIKVRNSKKFTRAVVTRALSGDLLLREAGRLINASPNSIMKLAEQI